MRLLTTTTKKLHDLNLLLEQADKMLHMMRDYRSAHHAGSLVPILMMYSELENAATAEMKLITE